ncbi:unnamed protein product [Amoebophrya sp. A25]|nr:unnamed protein product [Amoebophrya sp. A25]|eukprot:GSA25T00012226001.1
MTPVTTTDAKKAPPGKKIERSGCEPVVSGMACRMPQSPTTAAFWENLMQSRNMVTVDDDHWESGFHGQLPLGKGCVLNQEKFDNFFFNMSGSQAEKTDPQLRFMLELSYEAFVDSNLDIQKLKGSNCGVFVGCCFSDCHKAWLAEIPKVTGYENTGCAHSMFANRLSFFYDFHGPSFVVDTACSSSLVALSQAVRALENGECDVALVGGASITLHPGVSVAFNRLHMLSADSACMSFSKNGNGYARSEGVACLVLYRPDKVHKYMKDEAVVAVKEMKTNVQPNSYFSVLGVGVNSDGFTQKGITFPNGDAQYTLYKEVCAKANVAPEDIFYIEAHGTGTAAGDGQELEALRRAYLEPRGSAVPITPLLLGSVKSNMGHAEGASAMAGLLKLCLSWTNNVIPADLHYTWEDRNKGCEGMLGDQKKCMVVEKHYDMASKSGVPANGKKVAISSFGFGGTNAHAVLESNVSQSVVNGEKFLRSGADQHEDKKTEAGGADDGNSAASYANEEEKWRLITPVFGRTGDTVHNCLEKLGSKNVVFDTLVGPPSVHDHLKEFPALGYRTAGGDIVTTDDPAPYIVDEAACSSEAKTEGKRSVWLCFSGNGGMWPLMGKELYDTSAIYKRTFDRCAQYLKEKYGYDKLFQFLTEADPAKYSAKEGVCGLAAIQIAMVDMLKFAGVEWEGMFGHSAGETAMGYADGCLTLEETMSVAYFRSLCGASTVDPNNPGGMYACGVSRDKMEEMLHAYNCTNLTQVGCDNDPSLVTLSGSEKEMKPITVELQSKKILCRKVPTFGIAYHSAMLEPGLAKLREQLEATIDNAVDPATGKKIPMEKRRRSPKWLSTCYNDDELTGPENKDHPGKFVSAEYHCYNFRNTVEFYRAVKSRVPNNAVIVEIGPSGLFRSSIKKIAATEKRTLHYVNLMSRDKNCLHIFQQGFGQLFFHGAIPSLKYFQKDDSKKFKLRDGETRKGNCAPRDIPEIARDLELRQAFIQWDHGNIYPMPVVADMVKKTGAPGEEMMSQMGGDEWKNVHVVDFDFSADGPDHFMLDHVIDQAVLLPACGYLYAAWVAFANVLRKRGAIEELNDARDVVLSDFKIHQGVRLDESNRQMKLTVKFASETENSASGSGASEFKILSGDERIVTGKIKLSKDNSAGNTVSVVAPETDTFGHPFGAVSAREFYNRIARNGYNYEDAFQLVENVGIDDSWAWVRFDQAGELLHSRKDGLGESQQNVAETGQLGGPKTTGFYVQDELIFNRYWISFLDNLLQVSLLKNLNDSETLRVPTEIREVVIRGSSFGAFLKKMNEGSIGMRAIDSTDSVGSRASSLDAPEEIKEEERKSYMVEAQHQSGTQLVKILPFEEVVCCDIADIVGLKTSIMARSTKPKERRVMHVASKRVWPLQSSAAAGQTGSTIQVRKAKSALSVIMSYVKEQFVGGTFTVLDLFPAGVDDLTQSVIETPNVELFSCFFGRDIMDTAKADYQSKTDGVCNEFKEGQRFDVVLLHTPTSAEMAGEGIDPVEWAKTLGGVLQQESAKTDEYQPAFVVVVSDLARPGVVASKGAGEVMPSVLKAAKVDGTPLLRAAAFEAGVEFKLYKTTPPVPGQKRLVLEFSGADGLLGAPATEPDFFKTAKTLFMRLGDDCFETKNITKLSKLLTEIMDSETQTYPNLQKLFLLASADGFPGFLKCVQREPSFGKIRGVHLVSSSRVGWTAETSVAIANAIPAIANADARLAKLDVKRGDLSVELSFYDAQDLPQRFPAPFGRFLTFPQPGNLEAFAWKAHPHFSMLSLGDDAFEASTKPPGAILLPPPRNQMDTVKEPPCGFVRGQRRTDESSNVVDVAKGPYQTTSQKRNQVALLRAEGKRASAGSFFGSLFGAGKDKNGASNGKTAAMAGAVLATIRELTASQEGAAAADEALSRFCRDGYMAALSNNAKASLVAYNAAIENVKSASGGNPLRDVDVCYAALNFRDVMLAYNKIDKDAIVGHSKMGDGFGLEFAGYYTLTGSEAKQHVAAVAAAGGDLWYGSSSGGGPAGREHDVNDLSNPVSPSAPQRKVIGLTYNSLATKVTVPANLVWELKPSQCLRDFATVPCVYATCYYSLLVRGGFTPNTSVLIHAGAGGVGQAALYICLKRTADPRLVFTTCSSKKRQYLLEKFGNLGLREENIGNSRDCSFEALVMRNTHGRGVDICLNSLSDEKLMASVRCVAPFGRFCEIGKYDLMQNTGLGMHCFLKNVSFMGIDLDQILNQPREWTAVHRLVQEGLDSGEVEPLDVGGCFKATQITEAFRFMGAGTHVGKVLLDFIQDSDHGRAAVPNTETTASATALQAERLRKLTQGTAFGNGSLSTLSTAANTVPSGTSNSGVAPSEAGSYVFLPPGRADVLSVGDSVSMYESRSTSTDSTVPSSQEEVADVPNFTPKNPVTDYYLIIGGMGGFGLELAEFLASKGVKNLILSSRGPLRSGLQAKYLLRIARTYGCNVSLTTLDFTDRKVVAKFLAENRNITGFFNLGMVLADGVFSKMQGGQWETPALAKGVISENFHAVSEEILLKEREGSQQQSGSDEKSQQAPAGADTSSPVWTFFDHFVVFSSVSAGLGNAGQTNYGFANSALDALVRRRNALGRPALSVQWGAIGDVGVLSRASAKKSGLVEAILPQEIASCLVELEKLMALHQTGVVTVYVTPKRLRDDAADGADNSIPLIDKILEIVGAKNGAKDTSTLEQLGADSLQSMEIQSLIKMRTGEKIPMDKLSKMNVKALRELEQ